LGPAHSFRVKLHSQDCNRLRMAKQCLRPTQPEKRGAIVHGKVALAKPFSEGRLHLS